MPRRRSSGSNECARIIHDCVRLRQSLAAPLAIQNPLLSDREVIDVASDMIIRLIFLRMCEDRGIVVDCRLNDLLNGTGVYPRLSERFHRCESRFGTGLFENRPDLSINDEVLRDIIRKMYAPGWSAPCIALPVDLPGRIYEQFLGRPMQLNREARIAISSNPEARKTGGVYYTPDCIVEYIIARTIGTLLKDKSPKQASGLRILDPACGCGAFLLGTYRYLLDWHLDYYQTHDPDEWTRRKNPPIYPIQTPNPRPQPPDPESPTPGPRPLIPVYRLSIREKLRILRDHIHGVDIDPRAVILTRSSLLLLALENEPVEGYGITVRPTQSIPDRALVDLSNNIKCGNALIGPDFFDGDRIECSNEEERFRINAFDWQTEFPHIFRKPSHQGRAREESGEGRSKNERGPLPHGRGSDHSGFDAVIGNPPYLSYSGRQSVDISDRQRSYFAKHYQTAGWMTSHGLFIERAVSDLSRRMTAFVVPDQVGHLEGYRSVREMLNHYAGLVEVRYWGESVFDEAVTPALTFLADRSHHGHTIIHQPSGGRRARIQCISGTPWISSSNRVLLAKLRHNTHSLGDRVADPGVHTGNCSRRLIVDPSAPGSMGVPILEGRLISRYRCGAPSKHLKLDYEAGPGEYFTIRDRHQYREASFVIRQTAAHPIVGPREHADYFRNSLLALYPPTDGTDVRYLVGLLNTRLIRYVYGQTVRESRQKAFPQVKVRSLRALPIRTIDRADPADRLWHDQIVDLVQRMLDLHRRRDVSHSPDLMDDIQRRIDETDRRIDGLVYKLYGLTDDEISIVEKAADQSRDREGTVISRNQRS